MDGTLAMDVCSNCLELGRRNAQLQIQVKQLRTRNGALRRRVQKLSAQVRQQGSAIAQLQDQLRELRGPARATAVNSSIAPSANPPGAPNPVVKKPSGRRSGAQRGHKGHGRKLLAPEQVDQIKQFRPLACEQCGVPLVASPEDQVQRRHQQVELPPRAAVITEYQSLTCCCPECGWVSHGQIPDFFLASVCGPRLSAMMGYLPAHAHVSRGELVKILSNIIGVNLSMGTVFAREKELTQALAEPYQQIKAQVRQAAVKYVDETGWKRAARWLWVAATATAVFFLCSHSRTRVALRQLLGAKQRGVMCTDRFGVYDKYARGRRGLCWSHLKRDFQRCVDRGGQSARIGAEALAITREVFHRWRWFRRGKIKRSTLQQQLRPLRRQMKKVLEDGAQSGILKTAGFCKNLLKWEKGMWLFARVEGLEPTNNLAERMLRPAVIWRKTSFGSHSQHGLQFVERMLSVMMTVERRGGNVMDYLTAAITARREQRDAPLIA